MRRAFALSLLAGSGLSLSVGLGLVPGPGTGLLGTTRRDFQHAGTQAGYGGVPFQDAASCAGCHGHYDDDVEPYSRWASSLMAQAGRDPVFKAALAIAEQDADFAGDLCWRCHAPNGWLAGRALPTDGSGFDTNQADLDGVSCHFCHRLVDPVFVLGNPPQDVGILAALTEAPGAGLHTGQYVVDPADSRRGPFDLGPSFGFHDWDESPFHRESLLCASCHDVSNPLYVRADDGSWDLDELGAKHPTGDKRDEFPLERTFSEWALSDYALGAIDTGGRFGGNARRVSTCQDCHMPDATGTACVPGLGEERDDLPLHDFNGANSWVLRAVRDLYPDSETGLTDATLDAALARNVGMLQRAGDISVFLRGGELVARVVNQTGHKLPTGYGEGRRMWLNVRFLDGADGLVEERGAYDDGTATLTRDTRVWELVHGLDDDAAQATGLPAGPSFHFVLNNRIELDNRIPPRGFYDAPFAAAGAPVVGHDYPDEHYWDEAAFAVPAAARKARVRLLHQTTSREYAEFLRDANTTTADGQVAYDQWRKHGRSAPVVMAVADVDLADAPCAEPVAYGPARPGTAGAPSLAWSGTPSASGPGFALEITGGPPGAPVRVFWSDRTRRSSLPGGGFRFLVDPVPGPGVRLDGNGAAAIPIPVTAGMVGERRYYQVLLRDRGLPVPVGATNGLYVEFCE